MKATTMHEAIKNEDYETFAQLYVERLARKAKRPRCSPKTSPRSSRKETACVENKNRQRMENDNDTLRAGFKRFRTAEQEHAENAAAANGGRVREQKGNQALATRNTSRSEEKAQRALHEKSNSSKRSSIFSHRRLTDGVITSPGGK